MTPQEFHRRGEELLAQAELKASTDPAAAYALTGLASTYFVAAQSSAAVDGIGRMASHLDEERERIERYEAAAAASREALQRAD